MNQAQQLLAQQLLHFMQSNNGLLNEDETDLAETWKISDRQLITIIQLLEKEGYLTSNDNVHRLTANGEKFKSFLQEEKKERVSNWADWPKKYWIIVSLAGGAFVVLTPYLQEQASKVLSPASTPQKQIPANNKHNDQKKIDSSYIKNKDTANQAKGQ